MRRGLKGIGIFCLVVIFICLSYIKLYTLKVSFSEDPTVSIVKTENMQLGFNSKTITRESVPYNWYDEYGYKLLYADEMGHKWESRHSFVIFLWWGILIYIILNGFKIVKKIKS